MNNHELRDILTGFKRTVGLMQKTDRWLLILASVLMLAAGILTNLPAVILGRLVDTIVEQDSFGFSIAVPFLGSIIAIIIIREVLTIIRKYLIENIATQTEKKLTVKVIEHTLKADISAINEQQIGSIHGRIFRSIQGLIRLIKLGFLEFLPSFFSAVAAIGIAVSQKPLISSIMVLVIPVGLYIIVRQISSQKGIRLSLLRGKEKIDGAVVEMLGGIETIRVLNTTGEEVTKVESVAEDLRKKEIRHHISMALFDSAKYLNEAFFYILVISTAIYLSAQGAITRGDILVYSILFVSITGPLREIHRILDQAHESSILVNDLHGLLMQPLDESFNQSQTPEAKVAVHTENVISIKNLNFTYPGRGQNSLQDINIEIKNGEKIGIAGASGCGKSTLIKILLRLVHNYRGEITLFGKDLKELTREDIGMQIAYIPQKTYIFSGSVRENIIYGSPKSKISEQNIINAAKEANLFREINENLGGLDGPVTENGNNLSGGQKQRLAIARIILRAPDLLIFDEATSALDNTNEVLIQKNIEAHFKTKTMITIAHRLTTLNNCDKIFVMDKGAIIQSGSYGKLTKIPGLFKDFLNQKIVN